MKYIASGGFGSIYKAESLFNKKVVAIKKRVSDSKDKIEAWNEEIKIHGSIQNIPELLMPK